MDGRKQRQAVTAAEQAIRALAVGDGARAAAAAQRACALDQIGLYTGLEGAVDLGVSRLGAGETVGDDVWDAVAAALGPGPLSLEVEALRTA